MCLNRLRGSANIDRFTIIGATPTITPTPTTDTLRRFLRRFLPVFLLPPLARQLLEDVLQDLRVPSLADILVALDPVAKGRFAEGLGATVGTARAERELDIVDDRACLSRFLVDASPLLHHIIGHTTHAYRLELLEGRRAAN